MKTETQIMDETEQMAPVIVGQRAYDVPARTADCHHRHKAMKPEITSEAWGEGSERIIAINGAPIGETLNRRDAETVRKWLVTAWPGIERYFMHAPEWLSQALNEGNGVYKP